MLGCDAENLTAFLWENLPDEQLDGAGGQSLSQDLSHPARGDLGKDDRWHWVAQQPLTSVAAERVAVSSAPAGTARGHGLGQLLVRLPVRNPVGGPAMQGRG